VIFFADLSHVAEKCRATCEMYRLWQFEKLDLGGKSGNYRVALSAFVLIAEALVIEQHRRYALAVKTRDQVAQSGVGNLFVVSRHCVRRALERVGEHVGNYERARLVEHVESIANLEIVFPGLWSGAGFDGCFVPINKLLHVQAMQNVFE